MLGDIAPDKGFLLLNRSVTLGAVGQGGDGAPCMLGDIALNRGTYSYLDQ